MGRVVEFRDTINDEITQSSTHEYTHFLFILLTVNWGKVMLFY